MTQAVDTSIQDTEQCFRAFAAATFNPLAVSVTGLQITIDPVGMTITAVAPHSFENDGVREEQTLTVSTGTASGTMSVTSVNENVLTGTMDAGLQAIENAGDTTEWLLSVAYEKAYQGVYYNQRDGVPYFSVAWIPGTSTELELGAPNNKNRYREIGIFQVMVNGEDGGGVQGVLTAASQIAGLTRNIRLSYGQSGNIRLRQPSVGKVVAGNGWASVVVSTPYRRDAQPV